MSKRYDIEEGQVYGKLTVISYAGRGKNNTKYWLCKCDCGNTVEVNQYSMVNGGTKSCGCLAKLVGDKVRKHGGYKHRLYPVWNGMMNRCYMEKHISYPRYGGRGIVVHKSMQDFKGFLDNIPPGWREGLQLDRIDNDGNYEPGNLRWVSRLEQAENRDQYRVPDSKVREIKRTLWTHTVVETAILCDVSVSYARAILNGDIRYNINELED